MDVQSKDAKIQQVAPPVITTELSTKQAEYFKKKVQEVAFSNRYIKTIPPKDDKSKSIFRRLIE
jgi:hypothetical protein